MRAATSPLYAWHSFVSRLPLVPMLVFLIVSLPLMALSVYVLPYFEYAVPRFAWMVVLLLVVLLTQIRASMEHPNNRYLNSLTSYPINLVSLPTLFAAFTAFSRSESVYQSSSAAFLLLGAILYGTYAYLRNHQDTAVYRLLTRRGSALVQFLAAFAFVMVMVWALPTPAQAEKEAARHAPAAAWKQQLATANDLAVTHNKEALLVHISASSSYSRVDDYDTVVNMHFFYIDTSGAQFEVVLDDTDPFESAEIVNLTPSDIPAYNFKQAQELQPFIEAIKLSPREALLLTVPEITPIAKQNEIPWTLPWIDLVVQGNNANPTPQWRVEHTIKSGVDRRNWWIDAISGDIRANQK